MKADGLENVRTEPVMVPRWVRGHESAEIIDPPRHPIEILGLGGTVATPPGGIEAEVLPVTSFDDLRTRQADARGRIVLFDVPYTNYTDTDDVSDRRRAAAALYGAVAVLVRSVGPTGLRTTHTGSVTYAPGAASDSGSRDRGRGRQPHRSSDGGWPQGASPAGHVGSHPSRRRVSERGGGDTRPRASG